MVVDERENDTSHRRQTCQFAGIGGGEIRSAIVRLNSFRRPVAAVAVLSVGSVATSQTSDYEVRRFDDGPGWLVFD